MRSRHVLRTSLICALLLVAAGASFAQTQAETSVVSLMHRAAEQRRKGDYAAAAETYRQVLRQAPRMFEAHLFLGDTLRKRRLDAEAEEEFQSARRIRPEDPLPYVSLAELRRERFRFAEALALLEEGWKAVPPARRELLVADRGTVLRQAGAGEDAVRVLRQGRMDFPDSARIAEALARTLETLGRLPEALEAWDVAAHLAPENAAVSLDSREARDLALRLERAAAAAREPGAGAEAWENLARLRIQARESPEAVDAASAALKLAPRRSDLMLLRGLALERAGRSEEAAKQLKRIGSGAPEHLLSLYHRAYLCRLSGEESPEEAIWREAVEAHPHDSSAALMLVLGWKRRSLLESRIDSIRKESLRADHRTALKIVEGMALEESGRDPEAEEVYEALFLENPRDPESAARLSGLLALRPALLARRLEEESSRHSLEGKGGGPGRHMLLAQLLLAAGREEAAVQEAREAAALFPAREEVHLGLASILGTTLGDRAEISHSLDRAAELEPASPWAHLARGADLFQKGNFNGAVQEGEKVVSLAPDLAEGHQLLGVARRQAGDSPGAVEEFRQSLLIDPSDSPGIVRLQMALVMAAQGERRAAEAALQGDTPPFPELIYRLAWTFVRRTFLDRSFRGQEWLSWRDRYPGPAASSNDACAAAAEMLASLRDPYTRLRGMEATAALYLKPRSGELETDASGSPLRSSASVVTGDLGENFGYIRLTNLSDPSAREAVRKALDRMAERQGLVLDLRGNPGGLSSDADAIAGLLLEPGQELGRERTRFGDQAQTATQTQPLFLKKPLVILTDRRTGSAAERLAAGLQGAGRATVVGEGTFGKGAGQVGRLLPGGEMVLVTALENLTREGRPLQGRGVVPDVPGEDDESLEKAKELLRKPSP